MLEDPAPAEPVLAGPLLDGLTLVVNGAGPEDAVLEDPALEDPALEDPALEDAVLDSPDSPVLSCSASAAAAFAALNARAVADLVSARDGSTDSASNSSSAPIGADALALARSGPLTGLVSAFLRCGPITMIMFRPSCFGADSTKPSSSTSPASRCSSL